MPRPTIAESIEQAQEFFKSWRQREEVIGFQRWLDSAPGQAVIEQTRLAQQAFKSPTWRDISEHMRRPPDAEAKTKPPPRKRGRGGRPRNLKPEEVEAGINLLRSRDRMTLGQAYTLLRRELNLSRDRKIHDSALYRSIVSVAYAA